MSNELIIEQVVNGPCIMEMVTVMITETKKHVFLTAVTVVDQISIQPIAMNVSAMKTLIVKLRLNGLVMGSAMTRQIMKDANMMEVIAVDQISTRYTLYMVQNVNVCWVIAHWFLQLQYLILEIV